MQCGPMKPVAALKVLRHADAAGALLQPMRLRLLERLAQPASAAGLARQLKLPRQKLNYHLRELEREGLVELVEERRKGNCVERLLRATARCYVISPDVLGRLGASPEERRDRFSAAYLVAAAARVVRDVALVKSRADAARKRIATLTLEADVRFESAADRNAFAEELSTALARLVAKYHRESAPAGRSFRLLVGCHPAPTRPEERETRPVDME